MSKTKRALYDLLLVDEVVITPEALDRLEAQGAEMSWESFIANYAPTTTPDVEEDKDEPEWDDVA
jgi:hypothetical protein